MFTIIRGKIFLQMQVPLRANFPEFDSGYATTRRLSLCKVLEKKSIHVFAKLSKMSGGLLGGLIINPRVSKLSRNIKTVPSFSPLIVSITGSSSERIGRLVMYSFSMPGKTICSSLDRKAGNSMFVRSLSQSSSSRRGAPIKSDRSASESRDRTSR